MAVNGNFGNLFLAKSALGAYEEYTKLVKNGEKVSDEVFDAADYNKDGKVNSKDKIAINKDIKELEKDAKTYDFDGSGKLELTDLFSYSTEIDIDGDGIISQDEIDFLKLEKQKLIKKLAAMANNKKLDINGDGKIDLNDVAAFISLTEDIGDFRNGKDETSKLLKSIQNALNLKLLDGVKNGAIGKGDLAVWNSRLESVRAYVEGRADANLSEKMIASYDINGDGKVDEKDISLLESAVKSLEQQNGKSVDSIEKTKTEYETSKAELNKAKESTAAAKKAMNQAKKEYEAARAAYVNFNKKYQKMSLEEQKKNNDKLDSLRNTALEKKALYKSTKEAYNTALAEQKTCQKDYNAKKAAYEKNSAFYKYTKIEGDKTTKDIEKTKKAKITAQEKNVKEAYTILTTAEKAEKTAKSMKEKAEKAQEKAKSEQEKAQKAYDEAKKAYNEFNEKYQKMSLADQMKYNSKLDRLRSAAVSAETILNTANSNLTTANEKLESANSIYEQAVQAKENANIKYQSEVDKLNELKEELYGDVASVNTKSASGNNKNNIDLKF